MNSFFLKIIISVCFVFSAIAIADENLDKNIKLTDESMQNIHDFLSQKHAGPRVDPNYIKNLSEAESISVLARWWGLDYQFLNTHQHWHQSKDDITFDNFISRVKFYPLEQKYKTVRAECKIRYSPPQSIFGRIFKKLKLYKGIKWKELLFSSGDEQWFDINLSSKGIYSLTLWDWINTVAIRTKNNTFISHSNPAMRRWNETIPKDIIRDIKEQGSFEIYIEPNMSRIYGIVMDYEDKLKYEIPPKYNLHGLIKIENINEINKCFK